MPFLVGDQTMPRRGVDGVEHGGIVLHEVAHAVGDVDVVADVPVVLKEEGVLELGEVDGGSAGDVAEGGGRAAGEAEQRALILLDAGDGLGLAGDGVAVGIEHGRGAAAEGVRAVEVGGELLVLVVDHELGAELHGVFFGGEDGVVVGFDVELVELLRADVGSAAGEGAGDLDLRRGGDGEYRSRRPSAG